MSGMASSGSVVPSLYASSVPEDPFQQVGRARRRVGADAGLLGTQLLEEGALGVGDDVAAEVGLQVADEGDLVIAAGEAVEGLDGAGVGERVVDDRAHLLGERLRGLVLEVAGGGVLGA